MGCGQKSHFEKDGRVILELSSQVIGSHDQMWRCSKFNQPSQLVNNDHSAHGPIKLCLCLGLRSQSTVHVFSHFKLPLKKARQMKIAVALVECGVMSSKKRLSSSRLFC